MDFKELLKEWNGGVFRGAAAKFAKELNVSHTVLTHFLQGMHPSEKQIRKMSILFKKTEEEIRAVFDNQRVGDVNSQFGNGVQVSGKSNTGAIYNFADKFENYSEVMRMRIESLEKDIEIVKSKLDLILEKLK
ncbi:MAG: hypothetical protein LBH29_01645 [Elusimicrobiota bacterium]|jgi:hypothetical protein|nr:hypothetical protein [Elusimicrobiota bacterium]